MIAGAPVINNIGRGLPTSYGAAAFQGYTPIQFSGSTPMYPKTVPPQTTGATGSTMPQVAAPMQGATNTPQTASPPQGGSSSPTGTPQAPSSGGPQMAQPNYAGLQGISNPWNFNPQSSQAMQPFQGYGVSGGQASPQGGFGGYSNVSSNNNISQGGNGYSQSYSPYNSQTVGPDSNWASGSW